MGSSRPFGNLRKLKSGRYQARYRNLGKQVPADTSFATKAEARAWLATMETDILGGRHVDPSSSREAFGVFAARWLEARDLRPRTRDTYASQLAHILAEFESVELWRITPSAVGLARPAGQVRAPRQHGGEGLPTVPNDDGHRRR